MRPIAFGRAKESKSLDTVAELEKEYSASQPWNQFLAQVELEGHRFVEEVKKGSLAVPLNEDYYVLVDHRVRDRWIEQGLWRDDWGPRQGGRQLHPGMKWKHEEPFPSLQGKVSESEATRLKEQHEASRPIYQYLYQVENERKWIESCQKSASSGGIRSADANAQAHEAVKNAWVRWDIWDTEWGSKPGLTWKHEQPFDEFISRRLGKAKASQY